MKITHKRRLRLPAVATQFLLGIAGLAIATFLCFQLGFGISRTGLVYVIVLAVVSLLGSFRASLVLSLIAAACLNYFFAPPLFDLRVDSMDDLVRIAVFLATALIVVVLTTKLKRVEQRLSDSTAKLEEAQRIAHVGWWERDLITDRVTVSDEVCRILGVRPVGRWLNLIHPEDRSKAAEAAAAAIRLGGPRYDLEYRVVRPDGTERIVHSQADVMWDKTGRPLRQFGVLQDVTELRQAENELRASEARFRTFVDHATDAFFLLDDKLRVLDVNRQACVSLGYSREELIGMHPRDFDSGLDEASIQHLRQRIVGGETVTFETRHRRKDGTSFPVEIRAGQFEQGGRRLLCLVRDITERKRAEDELRATEERFRSFVDHATDGFFLLDEHQAVLDVNRQACESLGYSREEMIRMHPRDFDAGLDEASIARIGERVASGETVTFETLHRRKDGTVFPVEIRARQFQHGALRFRLSLVRDIRERKRAEEMLRESEAKLQKAQRIAHFGWWERDFTTNRVSLSDEVCRIFGFEAVDLPEWHARWLNLIHPEDRPRVAEAAAAALLPGSPRYDVEYRVVRPDGAERIVHSQGDVTWDESGRALRQFGVLQDITELRRAEQELRASEARFRTFVDHATDAFLLLDENWTVLDVNRQACAGLGYSREELIGRHKSDFDVSLDDTSMQRLKQRMMAGETITFETHHQRKDGTSFPVEVRVGQFEQRGRRYLCLVRDITERKRAEDELRESEERFRTLVQFSFDVYWESDAQHRFIRQVFAEGLADAPPSGSEIGKTRWEVPYLEPDAEAWRKHRETLDAHLPFRDFELARPTPDGGKRYVSVSGLPVFDKSGRFTGYRGVGRHITERKRAEEALRRSEAYLAEAQRLSHTGTMAFNATAPLYWSEESYRIWGLDPLQGLPDRETVLQRIHPDDRERVDIETEEALHQKRDFALEFRIVLPDGTVKYIQSTGHPLFSADGELVEMVGTHVDVTERKRAQEEHERLRQLESDLAHMNRLSIMGELTASLAHEILHPIATARNNARAALRFLDMRPPNMAEVREALACIVRDADRGKDIIDRIRDHIKKEPPRNDRFDINQAIEEVIEMVRAPIDKNKVSVRTRLTAGVTSVCGDRVQLQQVVLNLILNAVEAVRSVEDGARELSISTKQIQTSDILVAVQDSGPGIDPEHLERVFAPFYTTKTSGLGMGLSICRSIIAAHGGRLWAEANRPRGAIFQFTLPAGLEPS
jgi:PAS domain S-box-containing protein